jgi:co-chaperonin GroES (HSP10)
MSKKELATLVSPLGDRVLVRKDKFEERTENGIYLPNEIRSSTIFGEVVSISTKVLKEDNYAIKVKDRVMFSYMNSIPVNVDGSKDLFAVPVEDIVAVIG